MNRHHNPHDNNEWIDVTAPSGDHPSGVLDLGALAESDLVMGTDKWGGTQGCCTPTFDSDCPCSKVGCGGSGSVQMHQL